MLTVILFNYCSAQKLPDSTAYNAALNYYTERSGEQSEIFYGSEYTDIRADIGSVFFQDNKEFSPATIVYNGNVYKDISVLYDAFNDILVSKRLNSPVKFTLIPEKILSFQLGQHHFVRIAAAEVKDALKDRFYEEFYAGKSSVIAKRAKTRSEIVTKSEGLKIAFENNDLAYVKKDGIFYPIKSRGDLLKLFNDKADVLKSYIKSASLRFKEKKEEDFVKLATYYDQLSL